MSKPKFLIKKKNELFETIDNYELSKPLPGERFRGGDPHVDYATVELIPTDKKVNLGDLVFLELKILEDKSLCGNPILFKVLQYGKQIHADYVIATNEDTIFYLHSLFSRCAVAYFRKKK